MRNWKKKVWYLLVGIFILIQFYPIDKPVTTFDNPNDLLKNVEMPKNVSTLIKGACYDCHSNESVFPWYASVSPVKWWVYDHITEGREELNFSEWNSIKKLDKTELLDDIISALEEKEMPLKPYPLTHPKAKLSDADRQSIIDWAEIHMEELFE